MEDIDTHNDDDPIYLLRHRAAMLEARANVLADVAVAFTKFAEPSPSWLLFKSWIDAEIRDIELEHDVLMSEIK